MVEGSRAEAGTLIYERYLASDRRSVYLVERYADVHAAVNHLRRFSDFFADRFAELVERQGVCVWTLGLIPRQRRAPARRHDPLPGAWLVGVLRWQRLDDRLD